MNPIKRTASGAVDTQSYMQRGRELRSQFLKQLLRSAYRRVFGMLKRRTTKQGIPELGSGCSEC